MCISILFYNKLAPSAHTDLFVRYKVLFYFQSWWLLSLVNAEWYFLEALESLTLSLRWIRWRAYACVISVWLLLFNHFSSCYQNIYNLTLSFISNKSVNGWKLEIVQILCSICQLFSLEKWGGYRCEQLLWTKLYRSDNTILYKGSFLYIREERNRCLNYETIITVVVELMCVCVCNVCAMLPTQCQSRVNILSLILKTSKCTLLGFLIIATCGLQSHSLSTSWGAVYLQERISQEK